MRSYTATDDVVVLADSTEVPGLGHLPVNSFVLRAAEPVLVDTGLPDSREDFLDHLWSACDPADLRWVWLTHPDRDHTGSLMQILEAAPQARLVTTFLGLGILSIEYPIPLDRVFLLNPGQALPVGDRSLHAFRPPLFDSPATTGLFDSRTGTCFSSDCFGGPLATEELAQADDVAAVPGLGSAGRATALGDGGQPVGARRGPGEVPRHGARPRCRRAAAGPQHPPPTGPQPRRPVAHHARRRSGPAALRGAGPGRPRSDAGRVRACSRLRAAVGGVPRARRRSGPVGESRNLVDV